MFIILLQMVPSQVLISSRQHSKDKCALNEMYIFLFIASAGYLFFAMGLLRVQRWNCYGYSVILDSSWVYKGCIGTWH